MLLLKLTKEIIAFIIYQDECGQIFHFHHPHRFHTQLRVFQATQTFDIFLRQ